MLRNRADAGAQLAEKLKLYATDDTLVLALPRGGVPVAREIARELQAPLDVLIVRKLGAPGQEELAMGAIGPDNTMVLNRRIIGQLNIAAAEIESVRQAEQAELEARLRRYRGDRPFPQIRDRHVILIDDGMATGASALVAVQYLKTLRPRQLILAVPVSAPQALRVLRAEADEVVYLSAPVIFNAVGEHYLDFRQTSDAEVADILALAQTESSMR